MEHRFYHGDGQLHPGAETMHGLMSPRRRLDNPATYQPDQGLKEACEVALLLAQPLLLTGEPGTGKTQFAAAVARELGFGKVLKFETKSTSQASDLFYRYDAMKRFYDKQSNVERSVWSYIEFGPLGKAILRAADPAKIPAEIPAELRSAGGPVRSVVLIDEVDKAPRDFPNDILNEIEQLYFRIPEAGYSGEPIGAKDGFAPIVIITSNSERDLPEPFLRRCIFYHIPFPKDRLKEIIHAKLTDVYEVRGDFLEDALEVFARVRGIPSISRKPSVAELLSWLVALRRLASDEPNPLAARGRCLQTVSCLAKTTDDSVAVEAELKKWVDDQPVKTS